jgi:pimeloyl-ACP methyl ester carboxylesterase
MDIRAAYASLHNLRLYYEDAGRGYPLVMVHTDGGDLSMWDEQFVIFAREYRAIRYDLRGHGHSDPGTGHFSHALDLHHLLQSLKIERAFFLGCALGASTAVDFAIEYPEMTAGLILVNPALSGFTYESDDGPVQFLPVDDRTIPPLHVIRSPVMVLTGELNHPAQTATVQHIANAIPGVKKAQLTDTALLPNVGRPLQFNRIVLTFLEWARQEKSVPSAAYRADFQPGLAAE